MPKLKPPLQTSQCNPARQAIPPAVALLSAATRRSASALMLAAATLLLWPAAVQADGLDVKAVIELGNVPAAQLTTPDFGIVSQHLTGRLPALSMSFEQTFAPEVTGVISGALRQEIYQALSYPDLYQAEWDRIRWRQAGGIGFNPTYVPMLEDAYLHINDPARNGFLRVGQFELPFGYRTSSYEPPLSQAPVPTPVTEELSARTGQIYQASTFARWRDIGTLVQWQSGAVGYASGLVNGAGPNRMDDNGAKDVFARMDYRPSETDEIGVSMLWGKGIAYPAGFDAPGSPMERRRYGLHARVKGGDALAMFEYLLEQRLGLDSQPRQGWYLDLSQPTSEAGGIYVQYAAFGDGNAAGGLGYDAKQITLGGTQAVYERASFRLEGLWRWENSSGIQASYGRYLATMEFALGGLASAPARPNPPPRMVP